MENRKCAYNRQLIAESSKLIAHSSKLIAHSSKLIAHSSMFIWALMALASCQRAFIPDINTNPNQIVVEGYVEAGANAPPVYVILTRTIPFFQQFNVSADLFVQGAVVYVSNGKDSVQLSEVCWQDLDSNSRKLAAGLFGINLDSVSNKFNFCVYADLAGKIKGAYGQSYGLTVRKGDTLLTATTTIPLKVPIDSVDFIKPPGINQNDTMAQMQCSAVDPGGNSYYRIFNSVNGQPYKARSNSVVDNQLFSGQVIKFNLFNAYPARVSNDALDGLFYRGDTVSVKFCRIDQAHFNFWNTLEFNAQNQGPFSTYTRVLYNIQGTGGIGIWGGYAAAYFNAIVPKK